MDKTYNASQVEAKIYQMWEKGKYFTPQMDPAKKPFTILLPLPNANDPMHMGHALFTVQDIMVRFHRMLGEPTLWLPGGDHAGIETQYVFEKKLAKEGKSRFDFDRNTLYQMIAEFVETNKNVNQDQMRRLGFSLDWTRYKYSLDPKIVEIVLETFRQLHQDNLIYRAERLANYCTKCGTAFSDLEVNHEERTDQLYYLNYGPIQIATTRPETIFADCAVGINPQDKRYQKIIGQSAIIPLINKEIPIISDEAIKIDFGTGALKITPAHDDVDFEIGNRHKLPIISCVNKMGRLINVPSKYLGLKVLPARKMVAEDLQKSAKLIKTQPLTHTVSVCYRCKSLIEPQLLPQWYLKTKPLAAKAIEAIKSGKTKIEPLPRFEKLYFDWLENIRDWNISRQIVWGPRLPIWYCLECLPNIQISFINKNKEKITDSYTNLKTKYTFAEISSGLQSLLVPIDTKYSLEEKNCQKCSSNHVLQETDTFDTWFLSAQWPYTTLLSQNRMTNYQLLITNDKNQSAKLQQDNVIASDSEAISDFEYFYPTSVLDTLWDILFFWVARMMMLGIYKTGQVPFKTIHLHSRVVDFKGQKMSKSKGNVLNPIELVDKYGADSLRMALIFGAAPGSDIVISDDKVRGMRNFCNKIWNISRFFLMNIESQNLKPEAIPYFEEKMLQLPQDKQLIQELNNLIKNTTHNLNHFRFSDSAQDIYAFTWHSLADKYLEENKERFKNGDLTALAIFRHALLKTLKLLHPFMPFITEEIWQLLPCLKSDPLIISSWPKTSDKK